jgi:hypothetical protein
MRMNIIKYTNLLMSHTPGFQSAQTIVKMFYPCKPVEPVTSFLILFGLSTAKLNDNANIKKLFMGQVSSMSSYSKKQH